MLKEKVWHQILRQSVSISSFSYKYAFFAKQFRYRSSNIIKSYFNWLLPAKTSQAQAQKETPKLLTPGIGTCSEGIASSNKERSAGSWKRFFLLAQPEYKLLLGGCGFLIMSSGISMVVPYSIGKIIDLVTTGDPSHRLIYILTGLGFIFIIGGISNFCRVYLFKWSGEKIINRIRGLVYQQLLRQDIVYYDTSRTGDLISRLSSDVTITGKSITNNIGDGIHAILKAGVGAGMMYLISSTLCTMILSILPPMALVAVLYGRYVKTLSKKTQEALGQSLKIAEEKLSNIRTVKAFSQEPKEINRYQEKLENVLALARKEAIISGSFFASTALAANGALLFVLWTAGGMVSNQIISVGDLSSFLMYTVYVGSSVSGLSSFYSELMKGFGSASRIFDILDSKPTILSDQGQRLAELKGKIEFKNVTFSYSSRSEIKIFNDLSLSIEPGQAVAIVGSSGSGKSTLTSLLLRFYNVNSGSIIIDDQVSLNELDLSWWHEQIGYVPQEPALFDGTIAENISYGKPNATIEEIKHAAIQANAWSFIQNLPEGMNTMVGERGITLSGGQKQRIAIARATLKDPKILVFDEATSALDHENEMLIKDAIDRLLKTGKTVIIIAHRLSTIKTATNIIIIENGKVKDQGSFEELLKQGQESPFYKLARSQL